MYTKVFHINPDDFTEEQFDNLCERAKENGYRVFDYSSTSALDIECLDSSTWITKDTRDVLNAIASGTIRSDMVDSSASTYTPDYSLDQIKGFTEAEAWMLNQEISDKHQAVQNKLNENMSYFNKKS